jgi:hypothetical protein
MKHEGYAFKYKIGEYVLLPGSEIPHKVLAQLYWVDDDDEAYLFFMSDTIATKNGTFCISDEDDRGIKIQSMEDFIQYIESDDELVVFNIDPATSLTNSVV